MIILTALKTAGVAIGKGIATVGLTVAVVIASPVLIPVMMQAFNDCPADIQASNAKYERLEHLQNKHFKTKKNLTEIKELETWAETRKKEQDAENAKWVEEHK